MSIRENIMSFFGKAEKRDSGGVSVSDPAIARVLGIDPTEKAVRMATASRCISLVAGAYASNDQILYRETKDGPAEAETHPLYGLLLNGTASMSAYELKYRLMESLVTHGEAFAEITFDDNGKPIDITPHAWRDVTVEATGAGRLRYIVTLPLENFRQRVVTQDAMCHIKHRPINYRGVSPIVAAGISMRIATEIEESVEQAASNGFRAAGLLSTDGAIGDDTAKRLKENLETNYSGNKGTGRIIVVGDGLKYSSMNNSAVENQILESRKFSAYAVAQAYGVPPEAVGLVEHASWSSSEESNRQLVTLSLESWAQCLNQQLAAFCLTNRERRSLYVASDWRKLTAGNLQTTAAAISSLTVNGVTTANESRRFLDLVALPGGDVLRAPLNTGSVPHDPAKNGQQQGVGA